MLSAFRWQRVLAVGSLDVSETLCFNWFQHGATVTSVRPTSPTVASYDHLASCKYSNVTPFKLIAAGCRENPAPRLFEASAAWLSISQPPFGPPNTNSQWQPALLQRWALCWQQITIGRHNYHLCLIQQLYCILRCNFFFVSILRHFCNDGTAWLLSLKCHSIEILVFN